MIELEVETEVRPTESEEKIREALETLYPFSRYTRTDPDYRNVYRIKAKGEGAETLKNLFEQVRRQRIVQTLRNQILSIMDLNNNEVEFMVNKQALTRGKISLCTMARESPLGPVHIRISGNDIEEIIDYLFPETKRGKVIEAGFIPKE